MIKFVYASDNHGDKVDPEAAEALFAFCKDYNPDERVHGGDCFDFRALRRGVGAHDAESGESLREDISEGVRFLNKFQPTVFLWGNHEHRLETLINGSSSGMVRDYCNDVKSTINNAAKKAGAKRVYPYHADNGVHRIGPVAFIHGYAHGVNCTMQQGLHYAQYGGGLIHGHTHNIASAALQKHGGGAAYSAGCLCLKSEMGYASHRLATAKWGNGWVAGWIDGKNWKAWHVHRVGTKWYWATDIKVWEPTTKTKTK